MIEGGPEFWRALVISGLCAAMNSGCSPQQAYREQVLKITEPAQFGCDRPIVPVSLALHVGNVAAGPRLPSMAGDLSQPPSSILVAYSDATPPLTVLEADMKRLVKTSPGTADVAPRLDITLQYAFARPDFRPWMNFKNAPMAGRMTLDAVIVKPGSGAVLWSQQIRGETETSPAYFTSDKVEEALNLAYCQALENTLSALTASNVMAALGAEAAQVP